jgi:hypothetical protein
VGAGSLWLKMRDDAKQAKEGNGQYLVQLRLGEFNQSKSQFTLVIFNPTRANPPMLSM